MKLGVKDVFQLAKQSAKDFGDDDCPRMAAALAYYTVFAMPPLLILILMIVGAVVSREQVQHALSGQFGAMLGKDGASAVQTMITQAKRPGGGVLATILGVAALMLGATGAFLQLQAALNRAWEVKPDPKAGGIRNFVFKRLLSIGMVLGVAFLLLVSLVLSAALTALGGWIGTLIPGASAVAVGILQTVVSLVVVAFLFAAIFKVLPDAVIAWRDVWVGGLVTAVLFEIGKWALGLYLGHSHPGQAYGAAGSLAVVLVWIYYTAMIVLYGAEFTQAWAVAHGCGIRPEPGAVRILEDTVPASNARSGEPAAPAGKRERGRTPSADDEEQARTRAAAYGSREKMAASGSSSGEEESGRPGGGVGRREEVGGSGVYPLSAGGAPEDAEVRSQAEWGRREDDALGRARG